MRDLIIAVDVGRSSVKAVASYKGKSYEKKFSSIYSSAWSQHGDPTSAFAVLSTTEKDYYQDSKGGVHLFGVTAQTLGDTPRNFSESQAFHEFSVHAILYSILYFQKLLKTNSVFDLGINLTFSNAYSKEYYAEQLKKEHILFYDNQSYHFKIDSLFCFQQGYAALFNFIQDKSIYLNDKKGLVIDIGRYTTDLSLVDRFTLIKGKSYNFGTQRLISDIQDIFANKVSLQDTDVENCFLHGDGAIFTNAFGDKVVPTRTSEYQDLIERSTKYLITYIKDFVGNDRIDYVYFVGGGSFIFGDALCKVFAAPNLPSGDLYANATGIVKFLQVVN